MRHRRPMVAFFGTEDKTILHTFNYGRTSRSNRWIVFLLGRLSRNATEARPDSPSASSDSRNTRRPLSELRCIPQISAAPAVINPGLPAWSLWMIYKTVLLHHKHCYFCSKNTKHGNENRGLPEECGIKYSV